METINYNKKTLQILDNLDKSNKKPKLLLHACCGICLIYPLDFLFDYFDITVFYSNSNIYPKEEFEKRYDTLSGYLDLFKNHFNNQIKLIKAPYDHETYMKDLRPYANEKEGGIRCELCYEKRLREAFEYAKKNNFDFVCTTLTSGRQKPSQKINQIAKKLEEEYAPIKYLYSDFKKNGGTEKGTKKAKSLNLYFQNYCGCEYSIWKKD